MNLYNTLSKQVEPFEPRDKEAVQMFVCGPTVYDLSHLGHAKTYIQMDILARTLRYLDYKVFYLQNITDIDDKIIERARHNNISWQVLRDQFEAEYKQDMAALGNTSVTQYARATDHILDIIGQVETLIGKSHAYVIDGDGVYFEIATFKDYGKLSGRQEVREHDAQTRIDQSDGKRGWNDFCLWKFSKQDEPSWQAPFGDGRPGWHIEDTAISEHYFGPQYDIHGGAIDLIFPHHEAEITQMESASGQVPFVRYWMHAGFLNIQGSKMAKSTGNFLTIRDVLDRGYEAAAIRLLMLQSHYRSSIDFSFVSLDAANNRLLRWREMSDRRWQVVQTPLLAATITDTEDSSDDTKLAQTKKAPPQTIEITQILDSVTAALKNDLDTPSALEAIDKLMHTVEKSKMTPFVQEEFIQSLRLIQRIFGIDLFSDDISTTQKAIIIERESARAANNWQRSDEIRNQLTTDGIGLRDTTTGTIWYHLKINS